MENKIFVLKKFSPIGFKTPNYPISHCLVCRGLLKEICHTCKEKLIEKCNIVHKNDIYIHEHCYVLIKDLDLVNNTDKSSKSSTLNLVTPAPDPQSSTDSEEE